MSNYSGKITLPISVDVCQANEFAPLVVKQKDAYTREYIITLTENGKKLNVPTADTVAWFNCCNQTDTTKRASVNGTINNDGTVTAVVPATVMDVAGFIQCDVSIVTSVDDTTHILKSTLFYLSCEAAANPEGTTSAAEDSILAGIAAGDIEPPVGSYVPKTRTIADIDLEDDITASELKTALSVPTKTSDLTNDSGFITSQDVSSKMDLDVTVTYDQGPDVDSTASVPMEQIFKYNNQRYIKTSSATPVSAQLRIEDAHSKVTSIDANSTDEQYPSAKCVYDLVGDIAGAFAAML